jgi:hypothetical protein
VFEKAQLCDSLLIRKSQVRALVGAPSNTPQPVIVRALSPGWGVTMHAFVALKIQRIAIGHCHRCCDEEIRRSITRRETGAEWRANATQPPSSIADPVTVRVDPLGPYGLGLR